MSASNDWQTQSLRQLATINYGRSPAGILANDGDYPVVGTGGAERKGMDFLHDGDSIILGRKGTIDRVHFATGRFWTIDTAYYLSGFGESIPRWLYYFLQTLDLRQMNEATGVPSLSRELLYMIEIPTPPKPEQTKIAEILSTVDRAIEQTEALIAKQQRLKTGLMQDLLTRGIDANGNLRSESTHPFKDSPLGRSPVEWEVDRLESVAEFVTSGSRGWAQYYATEGALFLRIGNLTRHHINMRFDDVVWVNPPASSEGKRTSVMAGDLLISITADLGIIGVIPEGFQEAYVNQHISLIRLIKTEVDPRFIGWFLGSRSGQSQFEKLNESGAKAGLNLPTIKNLLVPQMKLEEQQRISLILDASTQKASEFQQRLNKLHALKTALMQDLLTGRNRVTPLLEADQTSLEP
jgi:type I restriction enzyme S subunit